MSARPRLFFLDAARALGIVLVVGLHCAGRTSRTFEIKFSGSWWFLFGCARFADFAVPMFLAISAFLWARSSATGWKRVAGAVWPYAVWSILFAAPKIFHDLRHPSGTKPWTYVDIAVWGKAAFHLYFLSVLIQSALLFPAVKRLVAGRTFLQALLIAVSLQGAVLVVQSLVQWPGFQRGLFPYPGATAFWYLLILIPAAWLGAHAPLDREKVKRLVWVTGPAALVLLALHLWAQAQEALGRSVNGYLENGAQQAYTLAATLFVLTLFDLREGDLQGRIRSVAAWLGASTLPIYLLHPIAMNLLGGPRIHRFLAILPLAPVGYLILTWAITLAAVEILRLLRFDRYLFGRTSPAVIRVQAAGANLDPSNLT